MHVGALTGVPMMVQVAAGEKPEPATDTVVPGGPLGGVSVIEAKFAVISKLAPIAMFIDGEVTPPASQVSAPVDQLEKVPLDQLEKEQPRLGFAVSEIGSPQSSRRVTDFVAETVPEPTLAWYVTEPP
jgi:hypothetical protein